MHELVERIKLASVDLRRLEEGWSPSEAELREAVFLKNWIVGVDPHTNQTVFSGEALGHPLLGDKFIVTSPVLWISKDRQIARTLSRWYRLGEPAELSLGPSSRQGAPDREDGPTI